MHVLAVEPVIAEVPCIPNPCGPFTNPPRNIGERCDCTCLPLMIGSPPNCRPECQFSMDCPSDQTCSNNKCVDPCPGLCGFNAVCRVRNHVPVCICNPGYQGDPFSQCSIITSKILIYSKQSIMNNVISILLQQLQNHQRLIILVPHLRVVSMQTVLREMELLLAVVD